MLLRKQTKTACLMESRCNYVSIVEQFIIRVSSMESLQIVMNSPKTQRLSAYLHHRQE